MSFGPSAPKPDYKNLWANYSGWLREAKSTYGQSSSTARAKAAAAGIFGATPENVQVEQQSEYAKELKTLRKGATAKELQKYAKGKMGEKTVTTYDTGAHEAYTKTIAPAFGPTSPEYAKYAKIFNEYTGAEPEPWEVYLTKKYGLKGTKYTKKELAVFKAEEAAGRRTLGATVQGSTTKSPWV